METAEHPADTVVLYAIKANDAILNKVFSCFHSNQSDFDIFVKLFLKIVSNVEPSSTNEFLVRIVPYDSIILNSLVELWQAMNLTVVK